MPRARIASGFGGGQETELVLDREFGLQRAAVAFRARQQLRQMMIALRTDHDIDDRRAADDLLALGLRDAAGDRDLISRPWRAASSLATRSRPSSE